MTSVPNELIQAIQRHREIMQRVHSVQRHHDQQRSTVNANEAPHALPLSQPSPISLQQCNIAPTTHDDTHSAALLSVLENDKFTDVTFIVGNTSFKAIRALLAAHSAVFEAMLFGPMMEAQPNSRVSIDDIAPETFQLLLQYCYCNDPGLTPRNVAPVRCAADKYQMTALIQLCDARFPRLLTEFNFCLLLAECVKFKLDAYVAQCMEALQGQCGRYARSIVKTPSFLKMDLKTMQLFLQSDHLMIGEEELFDAVLRWNDHQSQQTCAAVDKKDLMGKEGEKDGLEAGDNHACNEESGRKRQRDQEDEEKNMVEELEGVTSAPAVKRRKLCGGVSVRSAADERQELLKGVCPCIRFGLMDGKYFARKVTPLKCLSYQQMTEVLCFSHCKEGPCGGFNTTPRRKLVPPAPWRA